MELRTILTAASVSSIMAGPLTRLAQAQSISSSAGTPGSSARYHTAEIDVTGNEILYRHYGQGLPILMVHGSPRNWAEQAYPKLTHFNKLPKGGHFVPGNSRSSSEMRFARASDCCGRSSQGRRGAMPDHSQFNTDRTYPGRWTITFMNPPINIFDPTTIVELGALMTDLEADLTVKVVVFQSANPDFFIAHLDVARAAAQPEVLGLWREIVLRLSSMPVVSIAKIRGRTRGIGNEFVLACDMRFASRQSALFGQPEIGVGLIPGGGAMEWLPRLVGRSRALEIVLSADDFNADIAERYGWVNRTLDDDGLDSFVDTLARRLASFDRKTLATAKTQINRFGTPTATELQSSNDMIFPMLAWPDAQARRGKLRNIGYGVRSDFELNFGRYLPRFGQADDDETNRGRAKVGL
jgi:enoyl-CoA hydratase/carnithine racemase